ncbi:MAG: sugar ABC transporter permease [Propionicimonas sp.]|uniref:carbohydrate ABC transporter permease n=1 Tax=Propionicimonas sp. TaxID=1955623 RepID=UPI002B2001B7|nr:sugar ABC transporter permease [Propionicimonas sp.]MEA4944973.1 sugar ABC transporter permease [Propionicimonas sp.]MEA5052579.1 sugar ABC transporter permease [Propionicimonas sp.]MEA5117463.1 sugar ABC transporter permease [Propionicimonas sp.]
MSVSATPTAGRSARRRQPPGQQPTGRRTAGDSINSLERRRSLTGWVFLLPAALLIAWMNFYPMVQAFILSLKTGRGSRLSFAEPLWSNYQRLFDDEIFRLTLQNTFIYLIIQVPIMLVMALILANLLNSKNLRFRALWRTAIFLPCAVGLVSYSLVFRTMFANDGLVNDLLLGLHLVDAPVNWLGQTGTARFVIILGLLWRWTGYNMVFYLAALQNIDDSTLEAARIDGAGPVKTFWYVTVPQLKPMILLTAIMSTNGTIQLFDESWNLTQGGPAYTSMTMSHYLYELSFQKNPNFGYAAALSYAILIMVAVLAAIQMKVGDKRD